MCVPRFLSSDDGLSFFRAERLSKERTASPSLFNTGSLCILPLGVRKKQVFGWERCEVFESSTFCLPRRFLPLCLLSGKASAHSVEAGFGASCDG
jgi:hypothetical protein